MNFLSNSKLAHFLKREGALRVILYYILLAFTFLLGSSLILTFRVLPFLPQELGREIALYTSLASIFFAGFLLFSLIEICLNPIKPLLKKVKRYEFNDRIGQIVEELSTQIGIPKPPQVFVTDENSQIMSYGFPHKSVILLWRGYLRLGDDVLKGFIAHELWHIKSDIGDASFIISDQHKQVSKAMLFTFLIAFLLFLPLLNTQFIIDLMVLLYRLDPSLVWLVQLIYLGIPMTFLLIGLCFMLCAMVTFTYSLFFGLPTILTSGYRELFADSFAALTLKSPKAVGRAIQQAYISTPSAQEKSRFRKKYANLLHLNFIPLIKGKTEYKDEKAWYRIFRVKWTDSHPHDFQRLVTLYLINKLLYEKVSLRVMKELENITWMQKHKILMINPLAATFGRRFRKMDAEMIRAIYAYMKLHSKLFNLIDCSSCVRASEHDVFTVFALLLSAKMIDVTDPLPTMSNIMSFLV